MKRFFCFVFIVLLLSAVLSAGDTARITSVKDRVLVIDKGWAHGVEEGMRGKAIRFLQDSATREEIPITVGKFIVKKVDKNSSELYLEDLAVDADPGMSQQVQFDEDLITPGEKSDRWRKNKEKIIDYIQNNQLADAAELLKQSEKLKIKGNELKILKDGFLLLLADEISIRDYIEYKSRDPKNAILKVVEDKMYKDVNDPKLPPGKYLDASLPLAKNGEGYYEITITFKDKNPHVMIYIPDKNIFIDKFEVSNGQYLQFANEHGIAVKKIIFSDTKLANYPVCCEDYPAIVSYEDAEKYSAAYGLRLPEEAEWEEIAGLTKGYIYSWGNEGVDEGNIYRANFESMDDGYIEAAPVDSFAGYSSPYGLVNMMGNVSEWVKGKYSKGGGLLSELEDLKITDKYTTPIYVGFRCVMEVEQ